MKSRASVTVMVTCVCVKESSNIQSGWRDGKVNLGSTDGTFLVHNLSSYTCECDIQSWCVPDEVKCGGEKQLVVDGDAHVARLMEGGGDRSDGGPEGAAPAQEQKLSCGQSNGGECFRVQGNKVSADTCCE